MSLSPGPKAPPPSPPDLADFAKKANDLEAIKKAVDDAASVGGGLWLSYLFVLFYLAVAAGAVTHADLFLEKPVKLPFLGIELPLFAFFVLAPILFVIVHVYTLVHLVFLTEKAKRYHQALHDIERNLTAATRENLQWQLPSNIFIQLLAGPQKVRGSAFGALLKAIAWITLVIAPVLLLLLMQVQFLPYHSSVVIWAQRVALGLDLAFIWWLWRKILSGPEINSGRRRVPWLSLPLGLALSLATILFSVTVVTFPGEWQEDHLQSWRILPAMKGWENPATKTDAKENPRASSIRDWLMNAKRLSLHDWLFNEEPDKITRRRVPFSSTLVLPGLSVYEGLGIDDPQKAKWRDFIFRARGRDLSGAIFDFASLAKVDFEDADLRGASFQQALLQGASLDRAKLEGASLSGAKLQRAMLRGTELQGASLDHAQLQGAALNSADLRGTSLNSAQLQGASLVYAKLQGASLAYAQLQGASFLGAFLEATDLFGARLWRTNGEPSQISAVRISDDGHTWLPFRRRDASDKDQPWDDKDYLALRAITKSLALEGNRDDMLAATQSLKCANPDPTLASCDPSAPPPPEAMKWRSKLEAEAARTTYDLYTEALTKTLKSLVCSGGDEAISVVRGSGFLGRLYDAGSAALVGDLIDKKSDNCPISAALGAAERAHLMQMQQRIEEEGD